MRKMIGAREAAESKKRMIFKNERRTVGKEHELLSLEEAIESESIR